MYQISSFLQGHFHFQHHRDYLQEKNFCNRNYRQNTIFQQNLKTFGECQNRQNLTFKWPYQLYKSK